MKNKHMFWIAIFNLIVMSVGGILVVVLDKGSFAPYFNAICGWLILCLISYTDHK